MRLRVVVAVLLLCVLNFNLLAEDHFDTLQVGSVTYTNVTVMSKTPSDLFFTHTLGLASVKAKDLDDETRVQLGYNADERPSGRRRVEFKPIEVDPRVRELEAKFSKDVGQRFQNVARNVVIGVLIGLGLLYLFTCYCCLLICEKAGTPAPFMVWIPGLQIWALFRAAGMGRWTISTLFAPQIFSGLSTYLLPDDLSPGSPKMVIFLIVAGASVVISIVTAIVWALKISKARDKSPWLALFLLFPLTSPFAFLYLAFSNADEEEVLPSPRLVSFQ